MTTVDTQQQYDHRSSPSSRIVTNNNTTTNNNINRHHHHHHYSLISTMIIICFILFITILAPGTALAMISRKTVKFDQGRIWNAVNIEMDGFGFQKGGYMQVNITSNVCQLIQID